MERKLACRALRLWPDALADIIAAYSEWTLHGKIAYLAAVPRLRNAYGVSVAFDVEWMTIGLNQIGQFWVQRGLPSQTCALILTQKQLSKSIARAEWICLDPPKAIIEMTGNEIAALHEWLATVK